MPTSAAGGSSGGGGGGGGIDYFVSSELFEASHPRHVDDGAGGGLGSGEPDPDPSRAQRRYTERLYLMRSLTTAFQRPPQPVSKLTTEDLGLPPKHAMHLYLIPQVLHRK